MECPDNLDKKNPDPDREVNEYLKQFLSANPPRGRLRESNVHDAFALQLLKEGYYFVHEGPIKHGRYDFLLKKNSELTAVEIKVKRGDAAVDQLLDYIEKLRRKYDTDNIRGAIICGQINEDLIKNASKHNIKVIDYKIEIEVPL